MTARAEVWISEIHQKWKWLRQCRRLFLYSLIFIHNGIKWCNGIRWELLHILYDQVESPETHFILWTKFYGSHFAQRKQYNCQIINLPLARLASGVIFGRNDALGQSHGYTKMFCENFNRLITWLRLQSTIRIGKRIYIIQIDIQRSQIKSGAAAHSSCLASTNIVTINEQIYGLSTKLSDFVDFDCAELIHTIPLHSMVDNAHTHTDALIQRSGSISMQCIKFKLLPTPNAWKRKILSATRF